MLLLAVVASGKAQDGRERSPRSDTARLRAGDQIALHFLRDAELNTTVTVTERGDAVFPKLGMFQVTEWTVSQLEDTLRSRYAEYLRTPEFEIGVLRKIVVNGEVKVPNVYYVDATSTLRDLIARAGGLTEYGSRAKVSVIRGDKRLPVRDWDQESGTLFALQSGDQVVVGRKNWFAINALSTVSTGVLIASFVITTLRRR